MSSGDIHSGHRKRMRDRFLSNGDELFFDHELAEMLLFYCNSRKNVNPHAHEICAKDGLRGFINGELADFDAVFPAAMARAADSLAGELRQFARLYSADRTEALTGRRNLNSTETAKQYALSITTGSAEEQTWLLCLDARLSLKNCILLPYRRVESDCFDTVYRLASRCSSSNIILVYYHTDGVSAFTREEISAAAGLYKKFSLSGIRLVDCILCCDGMAAQLCTTGQLSGAAASV